MPRGIPGSGAAKNNPVLASGATDFGGQVGQDAPRIMTTVGDAEITAADIEPVKDMVNFDERAAELAFNEELIDVMVAPSSDRYAENPVGTWVNGKSQYFFRGQVQTVRRKYVEALARAKTTTFTQTEFVKENGDRAVRHDPTTSLAYPFSIMRDDNPRGRDWARRLMAQG